MGLFLALLVFLLLVALAAGATGLVLHWKFAQRPEKQWRDRVVAELGRVRSLRATFAFKSDRIEQDWQKETKALKGQYFGMLLSGIGVNQLENFPGIGPQTVARLRDAGYDGLQRLNGAFLVIPGIGEKRLTDINHAVRVLVGQAQQRFESVDCREAREFGSRLSSDGAKSTKRKGASKFNVRWPTVH